jgi:hypothetical protein
MPLLRKLDQMLQSITKLWIIASGAVRNAKRDTLHAECGLQLLPLNETDASSDPDPKAPELEQPRGVDLQIESSGVDTVALHMAQLCSNTFDDPFSPSSS